MTRSLPSAFTTPAQSTSPEPIRLLELETGDATTPWIRLCSGADNVTFPSSGGNVYTARPFKVGKIEHAAGKSPDVEITFPDGDYSFDTWLQTTDFRRKRVIVLDVERSALGSSSNAKRDQFWIDNRTRSQRGVVFRALSLAAIMRIVRIPKRTFTRELFPGIPREGEL